MSLLVQQIHYFDSLLLVFDLPSPTYPSFGNIILLGAAVWLPNTPSQCPTPHWPPTPQKTVTSTAGRSVLAKAGAACQGKGESGAPRGCGLHSGRGDPMLKGCQLGFCHGWYVLKTCRLLCLRTGLSEAVKCSHFSLLVPCFFRCCVDRSVTSSLSQGGKSTLVSLPCHWFPGYALKDRSEPVVVSACLIEIGLGNSSILLFIDFQQNHFAIIWSYLDILPQTSVVQIDDSSASCN